MKWNYDKNAGVLPENVYAHSGRKYRWKCNRGHEWRARVSNRCYGDGCPLCGRKKNRESKIRKVMNVDTGEIYNNSMSAAKALGIKSAGNIRSCCNGYQKTAGGYHWKYIN